MGAAHFGTLYLREIETPSWSEFANGENTEQVSRLLGLEMRVYSIK